MLSTLRLGLVGGILLSFAACGPSLPASKSGNTPDGDKTASGTATSKGPATAKDTAAKDTAPKKAAPKKVSNVGVTLSKMAGDVSAKVGIDLKKPPKMDALSLSQKKKLMPFFQQALGFESCEGCHAEGDFKKKTEHVQIAKKMWDNFVVEMRGEKGEALFCDSCHNGNSHLFDRSDNEAVQKFMSAEYTKKLTRADGNDQNCQSCHGDLFEMKIFKKLWQVKKH